jgi:hypothetical protein
MDNHDNVTLLWGLLDDDKAVRKMSLQYVRETVDENTIYTFLLNAINTHTDLVRSALTTLHTDESMDITLELIQTNSSSVCSTLSKIAKNGDKRAISFLLDRIQSKDAIKALGIIAAKTDDTDAINALVSIIQMRGSTTDIAVHALSLVCTRLSSKYFELVIDLMKVNNKSLCLLPKVCRRGNQKALSVALRYCDQIDSDKVKEYSSILQQIATDDQREFVIEFLYKGMISLPTHRAKVLHYFCNSSETNVILQRLMKETIVNIPIIIAFTNLGNVFDEVLIQFLLTKYGTMSYSALVELMYRLTPRSIFIPMQHTSFSDVDIMCNSSDLPLVHLLASQITQQRKRIVYNTVLSSALVHFNALDPKDRYAPKMYQDILKLFGRIAPQDEPMIIQTITNYLCERPLESSVQWNMLLVLKHISSRGSTTVTSALMNFILNIPTASDVLDIKTKAIETLCDVANYDDEQVIQFLWQLGCAEAEQCRKHCLSAISSLTKNCRRDDQIVKRSLNNFTVLAHVATMDVIMNQLVSSLKRNEKRKWCLHVVVKAVSLQRSDPNWRLDEKHLQVLSTLDETAAKVILSTERIRNK